jgi:hypothetical protein
VRPAHSRAGLGFAAAASVAVLATACSSSTPQPASQTAPASRFLTRFHTVSQIASTVPANGDVNPYGVAVVGQSIGRLVAGDALVGNYNSKANVQGTGTTIVQISPDGALSVFARISRLPAGQRCPGGVGLTAALTVLPGGWVVVGSLPQTNAGTLKPISPTGCLIVLDSRGTPVATWTDPNIDGPWDLTSRTTPTGAALFVSNVLAGSTNPNGTPSPSGACTIVRINVALPAGAPPSISGITVIGRGFPWKLNPPTVVLGPTGVALDARGTLYAADTQTNTITAITHALTRSTAVTYGTGMLTSGGSLNQPLGLALAPNGDLVAVNGADGNATEITPQGKQVATITLVPKGAGDLFGITPAADGQGLLFINDGANTLDLFSA